MTAGYARRFIPGPIHYEMIVAFGAMLSFSVVALWCFRRLASHEAASNFNLASFGLWLAFAAGWSIAQRRMWDDLLGMVAVFWFGSAMIGTILLKLIAVLRDRANRSV